MTAILAIKEIALDGLGKVPDLVGVIFRRAGSALEQVPIWFVKVGYEYRLNLLPVACDFFIHADTGNSNFMETDGLPIEALAGPEYTQNKLEGSCGAILILKWGVKAYRVLCRDVDRLNDVLKQLAEFSEHPDDFFEALVKLASPATDST